MLTTLENVLVQPTILPQAATAAVNGSAVNVLGYGEGLVSVAIGAATGTPTSFTVDCKLQESADGSTGWVDVPGASMTQGTLAGKTAQFDLLLQDRANLSFMRAVFTPVFTGGTSPAIYVAANILLGNPDTGEVPNSKIEH